MSAVVQAAGLLRSKQPPDMNGGYLDVLGEREAIGPHPGQQVFRNRGLPKIYEWLWRPAVARYLFGVAGPGTAEERRIVLEMLGVRPGNQVLDVGCGPGNYTRLLAKAAGDGLTIGLDASEAMVTAAVKGEGRDNLAYLRGDGSALPFDDETFDKVSCIGVIHLIEEPLVALGEMVRVLVPGGRLTIMASCARKESRRRENGGMKIFGRDELTRPLQEHGMVDIEQRVIGRGQFVAAGKPGDAHDGG